MFSSSLFRFKEDCCLSLFNYFVYIYLSRLEVKQNNDLSESSLQALKTEGQEDVQLSDKNGKKENLDGSFTEPNSVCILHTIPFCCAVNSKIFCISAL